MTKRVDHDQRRQALAESVWRVVRSHGVSGLTVRRVGEEAGWSSGTVQYYFPTRSDLLRHAFERVQRRTLDRISRECADVDDAEALRTALFVLLPISDESRIEAEVWFGFLGMALGESSLRSTGRAGHNVVMDAVGKQVRRAQDAGSVSPLRDPTIVAMEMIALADGLCVQALYRAEDLPSAVVLDVVDRWLSGLEQ